MNNTKHELMQAIFNNPNDDLCRFIFADWLDENGEPERAEFIRYQINEVPSEQINCHASPCCTVPFRGNQIGFNLGMVGKWVVSRGFPSSIACTMSAFMGGECEHERCNHGQIYVGHDNMKWYPCPDCTDGRVPGLVDTVFSRWPIERVTFSDRSPWDTGFGFAWYQLGVQAETFASLPKPIFDRLEFDESITIGHYYHSPDTALLALSHAAVDLGRKRAGLPAIRRHGQGVKRTHPGEALVSQPG